MKVVSIIPARGGSKTIPRKNLKLLNGKPLISYTIDAAKKSGKINRVIVSTDDDEIADVAKKSGAEVLFIRPKNLARDETPTLPVLQHAVKYLEANERYKPDVILLLYPTSPLLTVKRIDQALDMMTKGNVDSVVSVCEDSRNYKTWKRIGKRWLPLFKERVNRQKKVQYRENGAIYAMKYDVLMKQNSITGKKVSVLVMSEEESVDINNPLDFIIAETLMRMRIC